MKMHSVVIPAVVTVVLCLMLAGCASQRETTQGIEGAVTEQGGHPLAGMEVVILGGDDEPSTASTRTDTRGRYRIENTAPGTYDVAVFDRAGERLAVQSVTVAGGEDSVLDITLPMEITLIPRWVFGTSLQGRQTLEELMSSQGE